MTKVGGTTKRYYKETRGMKVSGGQWVKAGTMLTREGHRWQPGLNVIGMTHLTAACDGVVEFSRKRGNYKRTITLIHIRPQIAVDAKPAPKKATVAKKKTERVHS